MLHPWSPGPVHGWLGVVMGLACLAPSGAVAAGADLVVPEVIPGVIPGVISEATTETIPDVISGADVASARRSYATGIVGSSFATLTDDLAGRYTDSSANGTLFTAGGALGMAFDRPFGAIRAEVEGRGRDSLEDSLAVTAIPLATGSGNWVAADSWSTMVNVWRDFEVSDRFGVYLGGGIGGGGYRVVFDGAFPVLDATLSGSTSVAGFAWQAGTGATWLVTERVALDLGYRWYAIDGGPAQITLSTPGFSFSDSISTNFGANELLFTIRIYDPFRRWGE